jgi:hypothetical protein
MRSAPPPPGMEEKYEDDECDRSKYKRENMGE